MESCTSPLGCAVSFQLHAGFRGSNNFVRRLSFSSTGSVRVWFPFTDTVWIGTFYNFIYVVAVLFICCRYKCKSNLWKTYQQFFYLDSLLLTQTQRLGGASKRPTIVLRIVLYGCDTWSLSKERAQIEGVWGQGVEENIFITKPEKFYFTTSIIIFSFQQH